MPWIPIMEILFMYRCQGLSFWRSSNDWFLPISCLSSFGEKYCLGICTLPWGDPPISGGESAVSSHTTFVWDLMWSSPEWGALPQREALFSCHSPLCCLSQLSIPPGPGRVWMKGQSRFGIGKACIRMNCQGPYWLHCRVIWSLLKGLMD